MQEATLAAPSLGELALTIGVSVGSLVAVWLPLYRGLRVCLAAASATRRVPRNQLRAAAGAAAQGSLALLLVSVLRSTLRENPDQPREFVLDAAKQYVVNEWEANYAQVISMYANILPPIGFIGTVGGMLILFVSMHLSDASLELGALAMALTSTLFALIGFAALEGFKIRLYARLLACLDDVTALVRNQEPAPSAPLRAASAAAS